MKPKAALGWFVCLMAVAGLAVFLCNYPITTIYTTIHEELPSRPTDGPYILTTDEFKTINQEIAGYLQQEAPSQGYVYQVPKQGWIGDEIKSNLPGKLEDKIDQYRTKRLMQMKYSAYPGVKITF